MTNNAAMVATLASCVLFSTGALAQYYGPAGSRIMPPYEAASIAHSEGLNAISRPVLRGRTYVLTALDRDGRAVRVALDAVLGDVVWIAPVRSAGPGEYARGWRALPPDMSERQLPPGAVPSGAMAPAATMAPAAAMPADVDGEMNAPRPSVGMRAPPAGAAAAMPRTPLPRARPLAASRAALVKPDAPETTATTEPVVVRPAAAMPAAVETPTSLTATPETTAAIKPIAVNPAAAQKKVLIKPADRPSAQSPTDAPVQGFE